MNYTIIDEPHEILEIRMSINGFNDKTILFVMKDRASIADEWNPRYKTLNRREALLVHRAIYEVFG